ncbi:hypothetical protein G6F37_004448 [Rhizopus arrhizus]|nr:hypothetical protein G6F38_003393 [Rhizopus arrhizus]KAG1159936.1 hypothetical protein G6F37_004448 [Rhizopus arrhizus]
MGGPRLEVVKFGFYVFFPVGSMLYFGGPEFYDKFVKGIKFWPDYEKTHKPPTTTEDQFANRLNMAYFYAVRVGRNPGIYKSWPECKEQVDGIKGAKYKKFPTKEEAEQFVKGDSNTASITQSLQVKRRLETESFQSTKKTKIDLSSTRYPQKKRTVVYTDGASSGNGQKGARAGYGVYWGDNDPRNVSRRLAGLKQTNQRAEATAVIHALEQSQKDSELLEIRTDSQYVIKASTEWSKAWKINGWRSSNGKPVENRDLFEKILDLVDSRKGPVKFVYVPGHSGEEGNEKADQLAVAGAQLS